MQRSAPAPGSRKHCLSRCPREKAEKPALKRSDSEKTGHQSTSATVFQKKLNALEPQAKPAEHQQCFQPFYGALQAPNVSRQEVQSAEVAALLGVQSKTMFGYGRLSKLGSPFGSSL